MKKLIIKLFKIVAYSFLALLVLGIVSAWFFTATDSKVEQKTKDKGELFASMSLYIGACNEVFKGKNEIYLKDSIYTMYKYSGTKSVQAKNMATFWKEQWESIDYEAERKKSKECVASKERRNAKFRAKQKKNKDIKNFKKELKDAIDDL